MYDRPTFCTYTAAGLTDLCCAVGLKSRAEALKAASTMQTTGLTSAHMQPLNQHDLDSIQQLLTQNQRVLTKLQEVLRKDNRDCAILSQSNNDLMLLTP